MKLSLRKGKNALAWVTLVVLASVSLMLLNAALFSAWMSGGPPNPYPEGWALRAQGQVLWALAAAIAAGTFFSLIRRFPSLGLIHKLLLTVVVALVLTPLVQKELRIDGCFDGGGRWNYEGLQCEH